MATPKDKNKEILYLSFNQNQSCISCGTQTGFVIYKVDPLRVRFEHDFGAGIGIVEILENTNVLALVGGGDHPQFPTSKVVIWDDYHKKIVYVIERRNRIRGVKFNRDTLVVINETSVELFNFKDMKKIRKIKTCDNPNTVIGLSNQIKIPYIITPTKEKGHVQVTDYIKGTQRQVKCHKNDIKLIALNQETTKFATCSAQGTLIRIFDFETLNKIKELRRGSDQSNIYSINFSKDSKYLVSSSEKGTIHVYSLCDQFENNKSSLSFMKSVLPKYFDSEWSLFQIPYESNGPHLCCILSNEDHSLDKLLVIDYNGKFIYYKFDLENMKYQIDSKGSILDKNFGNNKLENSDSSSDITNSSASDNENSDSDLTPNDNKPKIV